MKDLNFDGLEFALNQGCYIKVFSCSMRYPVVRVERKNENNEEELVAYAEDGIILSALMNASRQIESKKKETTMCKFTAIDRVVEQGYTLHFFKLSNNQVLSTICGGGYGNYIPLNSIISDDIKTGFETLNASLATFEFEKDIQNIKKFYKYAESQMKPVEEYKKTLTKKKINKK